MSAERKGSVIVKILKMLGLTLLGVVFLLSILLFCTVKFLGSKNLSQLAERVANEHIDGHLKVGNLRVGFHPAFPILGVEIEDLSLISHAFGTLTAEERGNLPVYADSLLSLNYMAGSLDVKRLFMDNELALKDVVMRGLSVNLVIARNGKANYELMKEQPDSVVKTKKSKSPGFRINRFALEQPKEIRFFNAADSTSASVLLLTDVDVDGDNEPTYRLKFNGNVTSSKATLATNLDQINFGLNGKVYWDPAHPGLVAMEEMEVQGAFIKAIVTGEIDLRSSPIVRRAIVDLSPVSISDLLSLVSDSTRSERRLHEPYFHTDATIGGRFELMRPMNLTTDSFPGAIMRLSVPSSTLHYGKARLKEIALDMTVTTVTNEPDSTVIDLTRFVMNGEKTQFEMSATVTTPFSDPAFETNMQGEVELTDLPPVISEKLHGYLAGTISTDLSLRGTTSMFKPEHLHKLSTRGKLEARNLYFLSADTNNMVQVNKAIIDFGSKGSAVKPWQMNMKLDADTVNILLGGIDLSAGSLSLGVKAENEGSRKDTTSIIPVGGDLRMKRFNIISITDSAGARFRNLEGHITLKGLRSHGSHPEIIADLRPGYVSAGSLSDRIIMDNTTVKADLRKLPSVRMKTSQPSHGKSLKHREYVYISPEKVLRHAYTKRHHKPGEKRRRRVYGTMAADNNEILEWDLAKGFSRFLTEWRLEGSVTTGTARLLTPSFPLRNNFSKINLKFNNDTVNLTDISLLAGHSDISLTGRVTNVKRALTASSTNTLKANLALISDTIDINELSLGAFTGAAYAQRRRHGKVHSSGTDDDAALQARLDALAKAGAGSSSPLLVPVNLNADLRIEARHVLYSDLVMQNLGGDILLYDGGVNLHDLKANSDAGNLTVSALYSAPRPEDMHFGFGMELDNFNIGKFVKLVPAVDSIIPLIHDFSGTIGVDIAATCAVDSGMNLRLPTLDAAIRISGDNLAFIDPQTYRTLGKWLGFKNKSDNTIKRLNVEMTVADGLMQVYPFTFNIDRYRLGVYGHNDIAMNFAYHISVLKSPLPFKFGINISGSPKKYKVRFGGAKFNEKTAVESVNIVKEARINLIEQIENVFKRGVQNSRFAKLEITYPEGFENLPDTPGLNRTDSLSLIREGIIDPAPAVQKTTGIEKKKKRKKFLFF